MPELSRNGTASCIDAPSRCHGGVHYPDELQAGVMRIILPRLADQWADRSTGRDEQGSIHREKRATPVQLLRSMAGRGKGAAVASDSPVQRERRSPVDFFKSLAGRVKGAVAGSPETPRLPRWRPLQHKSALDGQDH